MYDLIEENRIAIENELMALVLNKNDVLGILQIKPRYLYDNENKKLLADCLDCYTKHGCVNPNVIMKDNPKFNIKRYVQLLTNEIYYANSWREQLKLAEESIVKFYKEDIIKKINEKLKSNEISYDDFMKQMKKLDEIQLTKEQGLLTKKEIKENIDIENVAINFKGFNKLSDTLKMVQGDFLIVGAMTGAGKSGFLLNLQNALMKEYQCIYFNMEMSKSTIYKRMLSINCDVPIFHLNTPSEYQKKLIEKAYEEIEESKVIVEHKASDIKQIKAIVSKLKDINKHTVLFIDHLGLTRVEDKKSIYEQITEVAKQLRQICLDYDCTIIGASQLNRSSYNSEELTLSMLKDSGELENSASKVILLYRDKDCNKEELEVMMNIDISKNRDGLEGIIKMNYNKTKQIFKEV